MAELTRPTDHHESRSSQEQTYVNAANDASHKFSIEADLGKIINRPTLHGWDPMPVILEPQKNIPALPELNIDRHNEAVGKHHDAT